MFAFLQYIYWEATQWTEESLKWKYRFKNKYGECYKILHNTKL